MGDLQAKQESITDPKERDQIEEEVRRFEYQERLRQLRLARLGQLDPKSYKELPEQLIAAAREGDTEYVKLAYEAKVDLDVQDKELLATPPIMATISNKVNVVKLL